MSLCTSLSEDEETLTSNGDLSKHLEDDLTKSSEDDLTKSSEDDLTKSSEDELTKNSEDDLNKNSEDELTKSSDDELPNISEDDISKLASIINPPSVNQTFIMDESNKHLDEPHEKVDDGEADNEPIHTTATDCSKDDERSVNYGDYTIDGFNMDGLIVETVGQSEENNGNSSNAVRCDACKDVFQNPNDLQDHIDAMHFNPCPICETIFSRSTEKRKHIEEQHMKSTNSEQEFQRNIERQSTLRSDGIQLNVIFVDDVEDAIEDIIKNRRRRRRGAK